MAALSWAAFAALSLAALFLASAALWAAVSDLVSVFTAGVDGTGLDAAAWTGLGGAIAALATDLAAGAGLGLILVGIVGMVAGVPLALSFDISSGTSPS